MRKRLDSVPPRSLLWAILLAVLTVAACAARTAIPEANAQVAQAQQAVPVHADTLVDVTLGTTLGESGVFDLRAEPFRARVTPGGTVHWRLSGNRGPTLWMVTFPEASPARRGQAVFTGRGNAINIRIADHADGIYKYTIAVVVGDSIFHRDPEIEVGFP